MPVGGPVTRAAPAAEVGQLAPLLGSTCVEVEAELSGARDPIGYRVAAMMVWGCAEVPASCRAALNPTLSWTTACFGSSGDPAAKHGSPMATVMANRARYGAVRGRVGGGCVVRASERSSSPSPPCSAVTIHSAPDGNAYGLRWRVPARIAAPLCWGVTCHRNPAPRKQADAVIRSTRIRYVAGATGFVVAVRRDDGGA